MIVAVPNKHSFIQVTRGQSNKHCSPVCVPLSPKSRPSDAHTLSPYSDAVGESRRRHSCRPPIDIMHKSSFFHVSMSCYTMASMINYSEVPQITKMHIIKSEACALRPLLKLRPIPINTHQPTEIPSQNMNIHRA